MADKMNYDMIVHPLSEKEGGGYLATFPDLPGCMADGKTPEEAIHEAHDALKAWLATAKAHGDPIPKPKGTFSGQTRLRLPKSLHAELTLRAKYEGVSFNTLTLTLLAEALGRRDRGQEIMTQKGKH